MAHILHLDWFCQLLENSEPLGRVFTSHDSGDWQVRGRSPDLVHSDPDDHSSCTSRLWWQQV